MDMIRQKLVNKVGMLAISALVCFGLGASTIAQTETTVNQDVGGHGNKYGKLRSTTHEQRLAAAANKAALIEKVKAKRNATGTKAPNAAINSDSAAISVNTPDTAK
jgi:hypothetical protein